MRRKAVIGDVRVKGCWGQNPHPDLAPTCCHFVAMWNEGAEDKPIYHIDFFGGPGGTIFSTENQCVRAWFADPFPSYVLVWSGEPLSQKKD